MGPWAHLASCLAQVPQAVLVLVDDVEGSAPREAGAHMIVLPDGACRGTIGGGALEWRALASAQTLLQQNLSGPQTSSHALGPELGQCCGGRVRLVSELFTAADLPLIAARAKAEADPRRALWLFGAGHVGRALVLTLAQLPFAVTWLDSRADAFPAAVPANVRCLAPENPVASLEAAPDDAFILIMTHSHALDLALVAAALGRPFPHVGLIGSASKRARFLARLTAAGFGEAARDRLICPIGAASGIRSKLPAAIALSAAAELVRRDEDIGTGEQALPARERRA